MQTDVPNGWRIKPFGSLIEESREKSTQNNEHEVLTSSRKGLVRQSEYFGENRLTDRTNVGFNVVPPDYITYRSRSDNGVFTFNVNDLGITGLVSKYYPVFRGKTSDTNFLLHLCNYYSRYFAGYSVGTSQLVLAMPALKSVKLPVPPLPEQRKIAETLSSVDDAIQASRSVIEQTRRVKEGLLQELLTKGIGHTRFKKTAIGEIPESWELVELQEACREKITYGIVQCGPNVEGGIPYVRVSDMNNAELDVSDMLRTSPDIAAKFSRSTVELYDVIYALRGKIGEVRLVREPVAGANLTQGTARLSPGTRVRPAYLLWAMRSSETLRQGELEAKGSTFREITLARLRKIKIPVPPLEEQDQIVERVEAAESAERAASSMLASTTQIKAGLLQDLLTGKVRVSV